MYKTCFVLYVILGIYPAQVPVMSYFSLRSFFITLLYCSSPACLGCNITINVCMYVWQQHVTAGLV